MNPNGCGPAWMPEWLKHALFGWFHEASCNRHDEGYAIGGDEARRKSVDDGFYNAMKRDSLKLSGINRLFRLSQAVTLYAAVRLLGWMYFNYKVMK